MSELQSTVKSKKTVEFKDLLKAWVWLLALTLFGYALSLFDSGPLLYVGPVILAGLILAKARLILTRYLGLTQCPAWLSLLSNMILTITIVCAVLLAALSLGILS